MSDPEPPTIWTVGHSTRPRADFLALLRQHRIEALSDVRRTPQSRRHPHFSREPLARSLEAEGIRYRHFEALGGHRAPDGTATNADWREEALRGYADYMQTAEFAAALDTLVVFGRAGRTAIMCAEADPAHCHRQLLSDALLVRGWVVEHIGGGGGGSPGIVRHALTRGAHSTAGRVTYPPRQIGLRLGGD
jgi:uncharacterized protein (DUF488 family)